ncbi:MULTISPECIES: hypothetical protein [Paenibacillus]|uniref:hypothetical protein n=1 Tax=Paenibacillus TaxID=44249 RepID=UPI00096D61F2|nr:hypothetical protein [Paenibacillus odorifer]OME07571.1 hypothetical protein BSK60_30990 [Paenibacillus odorifer]
MSAVPITFEECLAPPSKGSKAVITNRGMTFECARCGVMMPKLFKKDFRKAKGTVHQACECGCDNCIIQGAGWAWYDYEAFKERERKFAQYQKQQYGDS